MKIQRLKQGKHNTFTFDGEYITDGRFISTVDIALKFKFLPADIEKLVKIGDAFVSNSKGHIGEYCNRPNISQLVETTKRGYKSSRDDYEMTDYLKICDNDAIGHIFRPCDSHHSPDDIQNNVVIHESLALVVNELSVKSQGGAFVHREKDSFFMVMSMQLSAEGRNNRSDDFLLSQMDMLITEVKRREMWVQMDSLKSTRSGMKRKMADLANQRF